LQFIELTDQIESIRIHLEKTNCFGTEVESYLTNALLISIYANFESKIKAILNAFIIENFSKKYSGPFFTPYIDNLVRRLKTGDIADNILKKLGHEFSNSFKQGINEIKQNESAYNNIIINRNKIAHGEGSNITFWELEESFPKSIIIIELVEKTIKIL
jgi:hypothetical protein